MLCIGKGFLPCSRPARKANERTTELALTQRRSCAAEQLLTAPTSRRSVGQSRANSSADRKSRLKRIIVSQLATYYFAAVTRSNLILMNAYEDAEQVQWLLGKEDRCDFSRFHRRVQLENALERIGYEFHLRQEAFASHISCPTNIDIN